MNNKQAKRIRRAMRSEAQTPSGLTGFPVYENGVLRFKITYHATGSDRLYKMGKKIFKKYGVLPIENA